MNDFDFDVKIYADKLSLIDIKLREAWNHPIESPDGSKKSEEPKVKRRDFNLRR